MPHPQQKLIQEVWPDKMLYGSTMILLVGLLGLVQSIVLASAPLSLGARVPIYLHPLDDFWTIILCGLASLLAFLAIRRRSLALGWIAVAAALVSGALLGLAALFALVAAGFLVKAQLEGEHTNEDTKDLHVLEWPDKSLAASLVALVGGGVAIAWAALLLSGLLSFTGPTNLTWGAASLVAGALDLAAAWQLYRQRGRGLGIGASIVSIVAAAGVGVGAVLGIVTLGLIWKATAEDEFEIPVSS